MAPAQHGKNKERGQGKGKGAASLRLMEPTDNKPLNQLETQTKYSTGKGRGRDYVEAGVLEADLEWVKNQKYHTKELTTRGNVVLKNPKFLMRK